MHLSVMKKLLGPFIASTPASFDVPGSAEEGVRLLKNVVHSSLFPPLTHQALLGRVTPSRVTLWRHRPFVQNSFTPMFSGTFISMNGRTVLSGRFAMHKFVRVGLVLGVSFSLLLVVFLLVTFPAAFSTPIEKLTMLLVPLVVSIFSLGLTHFGWWLARGDVGYVEAAIKSALHHGGT